MCTRTRSRPDLDWPSQALPDLAPISPDLAQVMPAKKARPFTASCLSDAAWVQFREKLLGKGGGAFPCLANGRVEVRRSRPSPVRPDRRPATSADLG